MLANRNINYSKKSFIEIRQELFNYVKQYYPEDLKDFSDSSVGTLLIELIAGLGDSLFHQIDRSYQETQIDYAQQRKSLYNLARTYGLNIPPKRGSVTAVDITVTLPVNGEAPDYDYAPIIKRSTQITGGGRVFEVLDDIDFSSKLSNLGFPNRTIVPIIDANETVQAYRITKREVVFNGRSTTINYSVTSTNFTPFIEFILPDDNVLEIDSIIVKQGLNVSEPTIDEYFGEINRFYEVNNLSEDRVFIENTSLSNPNQIKVGKWVKVSKKFIKEYTPQGFCKVIFGGGNGNKDLLEDSLRNIGVTSGFENYLNNTSLGEIPNINSTVFIRYRVGGGTESNIGVGVLNSFGNRNFFINGVDAQLNQQVLRSVTVTNPIPALGGADQPSIDTLRYLIKYNFTSQNRCVTLQDYKVQLEKMGGKYGRPFKNTVQKVNNKILISILGLNSNGKLDNQSTNLLKQNIATYLSQYRMVNDYVEVNDGKIINLALDIEVLIGETPVRDLIANNVILQARSFFDISKTDMGDDIFLAQLYENINNINGVLNVTSLKVFNKVGGVYSNNEIEMKYSNNTTREIQLVNNSLYSSENSMFEIKFPEKDIRIFLKSVRDGNF